MDSPISNSVSRKDIVPIADMLSQAFLDEPGLSWMIPEIDVRKRVLPGFFRAIVGGTYRFGRVIHTSDNKAATLWRFHGRTNPGFLEALYGLPFMLNFLRQAGPRAKLMSKAVLEHSPAFPYRYLQFAGVLPDVQGKGKGGAVIRAGLDEAASVGEPVYLETPKLENVAIYSRLGFEIIDEWNVEGSDLSFTSMLKKP